MSKPLRVSGKPCCYDELNQNQRQGQDAAALRETTANESMRICDRKRNGSQQCSPQLLLALNDFEMLCFVLDNVRTHGRG